MFGKCIVVFLPIRNLLISEDGGAAARALIESMQLQARLYEDWVEVMKDYSTVFCSGDQDEDSSDNAKEKSAEVNLCNCIHQE